MNGLRGTALAGLWLLVLGVLLGGCSTPAGPTVGLRNDTDTLMRVQFWTGDRDASRPGGARVGAAKELQVGPRQREQTSLTPMWDYRSPADTVVRVQIKPAVTSFGGPSEYWFELTPPSPFMIRVRREPGLGPGQPGGFVFEREGRGALTPVPEEFWVKR